MKHEFLNGDALEEIIVDNSVDLFIMHPPYLGIDFYRYANPEKQINRVKNRKSFVKKLIKITKNCEKALKTHGNILMILPVNDVHLLPDFLDAVAKKTDLQINTTMIWSIWNSEFVDGNSIYPVYSNIVHLSKGSFRRDPEKIKEFGDPVFTIAMNPNGLPEYKNMGHTEDAMPLELAERLIEMFSRSGDTVADVLGGTGTVSIAAENTGRDSIYNDVSFVQVKIAKKRMDDLIDSKKRSKA